MPTITLLTRREAIRLCIAALAANAAVEAFAQEHHSQLPMSETLSANGIKMQIRESMGKSGPIVQVTFSKEGATLFEATTRLTRIQVETQIAQTLTDGHGFTYHIEVYAKRPPGQQNAEVSFVVSIHQPTGERQTFAGRMDAASSDKDVKYPPPIDEVMPPSLREELTPIKNVVDQKNRDIEKATGINITPEKGKRPPILSERNCHLLCAGLSGLGAFLICAGTEGIGCGIAQIGFGLALSECSDSCPK